MVMASGNEPQIKGSVRSQDLSVSWISESGTAEKNTDRVCILMMANGQIRLTMQSSTIDLKGMRLTKGHICVFALFESSDDEVADKASEIFMNMIMRYDITKKPSADVLRKCMSKTEKKIDKEFKGSGYKASVAAFAAKDLTVCTAGGGRVFIISDDDNIQETASDTMEILPIGQTWKNVMIASGSYPAACDQVKQDIRLPIGDMITKLRSLPHPSSVIRVQRI